MPVTNTTPPAAVASQVAGPAGPSPEDARLAALLANRADVAAAPSEAELKPKADLVKALLPLVMAQAADLVSTQGLINSSSPSFSTFERNPLPGMGSTAGRLGWGAAETALIAALLKATPGLGKVVRDSAIVTHGTLASGNNDLAAEARSYAASHPMEAPTSDQPVPLALRKWK